MTAPVHVPLPLPALSTLTGRNLSPGYCPACLDRWYGHYSSDRSRHAGMHDGCRRLLEAIEALPVELAA